jgi:peptide/nickel transport system substrate-binding protein
MNRRTFILSSGAAIGLTQFPSLSFAQTGRSLLRWVPETDLALLDPMFTTATITACHALQVFDTLYGLDENYQPQPQMVGSQTLENNDLTWKLTLREGLKFHDGSAVTSKDIVASIIRFGKRNPLGQTLFGLISEIKTVNDKTIEITLSKPFPLLMYSLSGSSASIMPERLAMTPDNVPVKEMIGSGPYRFIAEKWVSGSTVVYEKFNDYVPRTDGIASNTAGPKIAHVTDIKWQVINDRATAVAALQNNEVDGIESVDNDFIPVLRKDPAITLIKASLPAISILRFNHLYPPFDNVLMRRAILAVVNQTEYMTAANGSEFPEYWHDQVGVWVPGTPMATTAGLEKLTGKRDFALARSLIKEAGYKGEPIVLLDPVDSPKHHASALVTADLFKKLGLKVDLRSMDWGSYLQRRNSQDPPASGGWHVGFTAMTGTSNLDPTSNLGIRGTGKQAWFGWPTNPTIEKLRTDWFYAPTLEQCKALCQDIQLQVLDQVPYIPLGAIYNLMALRKGWTNFQAQGPVFYTMRKG